MKGWKNIAIVFVLLGAMVSQVQAQRINFSTWAGSEDIIITPVGKNLNNLKFNDIQKVLVVGSGPVNIRLIDDEVVVFRIDAPSELEVTVELTAPGSLALSSDASKTIPLTLNLAYSNDVMALNSAFPNPEAAVLVPLGFNSVTFPISRRAAGGAPLPPTPDFGGIGRPKSSAFVFIYGTLGKIPAGSPAGNYTADVILSVYVTPNN